MIKKYYTQVTLFLIVFVLTVVSILSYRNLNNYINEVEQIRNSNSVLRTLEEVFSSVKDAETGHRGYELTRDTTFLLPYTIVVKSIGPKINILDSLVSENEAQRLRVDTLRNLIDYQFILINRILYNTANSGLYLDTYEINMLLEGKKNMDKIRNVVNNIRAVQTEITSSRTQKEATLREIAPIAILIYSLLAIGASVILFYGTLTALGKKKKAEQQLLEKNNSLEEEIKLRYFTQSLLSNILNHSLSGIMAFKSVREKGAIVDFEWILTNQESTKLTEKEESELIGQRLLEKMPGNREDLFDDYVKVVESGKPLILEKLYQGENLNKWFHLEAVKLEDGFVVTFSDITDRKSQDNQLQQINEDLRRSNEDLEQFAYVASHDLQEPLRKIRAFGDLLTSEFKDVEGAHDYIHRMQNAASRMQVLIQDLLSFSRASRGTSQFESLNLASIITEVLDDLENQIRREQAEVTVESADYAIRGDKVQIKRLFQNLISNAIKFHKTDVLPKVSVHVKILTEEELRNHFPDAQKNIDYLQIIVADNGIGFGNQYAEKIFNIFQRLHGRLDYEGTGIGLAICRKIVSNHRGYILATSEEQVGSKFIVILPNT
ncbi:MAG: CHASE3 domain-containing protein [Cyclobacteriaceae bacterium]|jgi:signal transduction histidine kinase|nr:CHASE3 domain-containing protein [Cyclobacteriaceae bacterium]